jgi:hypothetical protein
MIVIFSNLFNEIKLLGPLLWWAKIGSETTLAEGRAAA